MKKSVIILILVVAVLAAGFYFFSSDRQTKTLQAAKKSELSGDVQQALTLYAEQVFTTMPSIEKPDINRSKFLTPEELKNEIGKYLIWISTPGQRDNKDLTYALEGITRCENQDRLDNTITEPVIRPLTTDQYLTEWNKTFFAPNVKVDPSHAALASGNYLRKLSLLVLSSTKNYTYEINLINPATYHGTKCILLAQNSVRLYVLPGKHLLLCRSTIDFSETEVWRSSYTPIHITIPDTVSLITAELRTSIRRK